MTPINSKVFGAQVTTALLQEGLRLRVQVTGTSMRPTLESGDQIELEAIKHSAIDLPIGSLILFKTRNGHLCLHRLIARTQCAQGHTHLRTAGDALRRADPEALGSDVLGVVTAIWKAGGQQRRHLTGHYAGLHGLLQSGRTRLTWCVRSLRGRWGDGSSRGKRPPVPNAALAHCQIASPICD